MRLLRSIPPLIALLLLVRPASATHVTVPDDHPGIQAAIDSGADTVFVRPGKYCEVVTCDRRLSLIGALPEQTTGPFASFRLPEVDGLNLTGGPVNVFDLCVRGAALLNAPGNNPSLVQGCVFHAGITFWNGICLLKNCIVFGDCTVGYDNVDVGQCTIIGGSLTVSAAGTSIVHDNVVLGPAPIGIAGNADVHIRGNYVRGCVDGIRTSCDVLSLVVDNVVEDCSGSGYVRTSSSSCSGPGAFSGNVARRCGARGIDFPGESGYISSVRGCVVEDSGAEGIVVGNIALEFSDNIVLRSGGTGIVLRALHEVRNNRVIAAQGDGISAVTPIATQFIGNVVGRCAQRGIVIAADYGARLRNNTLYLNSGAGIEFTSNGTGDSLTNNLTYRNRVGLAWTGSSIPFLGCNDWFGDTDGAVTGTPVGASDVSLNPLFCGLASDDVSLSATSPIAALAGCGAVGALGVQCDQVVFAPGQAGPSLGRLVISPAPSRGVTRFAWTPTELPVELVLFDVSGARRWAATPPAGTREHTWSGLDSTGRPLPAGFYFARLIAGTRHSDATVVVIR